MQGVEHLNDGGCSISPSYADQALRSMSGGLSGQANGQQMLALVHPSMLYHSQACTFLLAAVMPFFRKT